MKLLQRKKALLLAIDKHGWLHERVAHELIGGTLVTDDLALTFKAVNELCKAGYIKTMWKDKDVALMLNLKQGS